MGNAIRNSADAASRPAGRPALLAETGVARAQGFSVQIVAKRLPQSRRTASSLIYLTPGIYMPLDGVTLPTFPDPLAPAPLAIHWIMLRTATGAPALGQSAGGQFRPSTLGCMTREFWLNLIMDYPEYSFEPLLLTPDQLTAMVRGPHREGPYPPLRGIISHFKAAVTRAAGLSRPIWAPGYTVLSADDSRTANCCYRAPGPGRRVK